MFASKSFLAAPFASRKREMQGPESMLGGLNGV